MAHRDFLNQTHGWIHDLARAETHPDAERLLNLGSSFDPQQLVEESTIDFLTELRGHLTEFCRLFNNYSENGDRFNEAKIYSVAQTSADFMIFRNQVKLIFSNSAHGVIRIEFSKHQQTGLPAMSSTDSPIPEHMPEAQELLAQVGPFRDVFWTFQEEKVSAEQIAKFYLAEFIRTTRDRSRSSSNQVLLDQIKGLLEEKGLQL